MAVDVQMKRILLVEDEESTRVLLKGILQRAGFTQVAALEDPRKTVERYLSYGPDLIVIDYHMPKMTGLEAIELLRPYLPEYFPILMLTADERPELRQKALASGAKDFLTKPVNAIDVELRIRNLLEARGELITEPLPGGPN